MKNRVTYLIAGLTGLMLLIAGVSTLAAQRPPFPLQPPGMMMGGFGPQHGRFSVAFASATKVLILDTSTGKVYHVKEADFLDSAKLPKMEVPPTPRFPGEGEKGRREDGEKKDAFESNRPRR
jgi:hypothetical protein